MNFLQKDIWHVNIPIYHDDISFYKISKALTDIDDIGIYLKKDILMWLHTLKSIGIERIEYEGEGDYRKEICDSLYEFFNDEEYDDKVIILTNYNPEYNNKNISISYKIKNIPTRAYNIKCDLSIISKPVKIISAIPYTIIGDRTLYSPYYIRDVRYKKSNYILSNSHLTYPDSLDLYYTKELERPIIYACNEYIKHDGTHINFLLETHKRKKNELVFTSII